MTAPQIEPGVIVFLVCSGLFTAACLTAIALMLLDDRWWKGQCDLYDAGKPEAAEARRVARPWCVRLLHPWLPA